MSVSHSHTEPIKHCFGCSDRGIWDSMKRIGGNEFRCSVCGDTARWRGAAAPPAYPIGGPAFRNRQDGTIIPVRGYHDIGQVVQQLLGRVDWPTEEKWLDDNVDVWEGGFLDSTGTKFLTRDEASALTNINCPVEGGAYAQALPGWVSEHGVYNSNLGRWDPPPPDDPFWKPRKAQVDRDCASCEEGNHQRCSGSDCDCARNNHGRAAAVNIVDEPEMKSPQGHEDLSEPSTFPAGEQPDKTKLFPEIDHGVMRRTEGQIKGDLWNTPPFKVGDKVKEPWPGGSHPHGARHPDWYFGTVISVVPAEELEFETSDHGVPVWIIEVMWNPGEPFRGTSTFSLRKDGHTKWFPLYPAEAILAMRVTARGGPTKPQKCHECKNDAVKSIIWAEGMAYVPVCNEHFEPVKHELEVDEGYGPIDGVKEIEKKADLESDVHQAIGEASMCWDPLPSSQIFDATAAHDVAIRLLDAIKKHAGEGHSGTFIGLMVPPEIAEKIAVPEGEPANDMHITLFYSKGLTAEQNKKAEQIFKHFWDAKPPLHVKLSGLDEFPPSESSDDKKVIYAAVDSPDLMDFHKFVIEALAESGIKSNSEHQDYKPHVTIQYVDPDKGFNKFFNPVEFDIQDYKFQAGSEPAEEKPEHEAEIGFSLSDLTKNAQDIRIDDYRRMDNSYRDHNQSEDPDLHLGSKPRAEADVEAPYTGMGVPDGEMFDKDHEMNIKMHANIGQGSDPYRIGHLYSYGQLIDQHQHEVDLNWCDRQKNPTGRHFMWIRTSMPIDTIVKESKKWYDKNRNRKWGHKDQNKIITLAEKIESGAVVTPLLVSPPGEKNGGLWEGYHRLRAHDMLSYATAPVMMKVDVSDPDWKMKLAQAMDDEEREPWFCVDLDGTILEEDPNAHHRDHERPPLGEPFPEVARVMGELCAMGRVSIYTARQYFEDDNDDGWKQEISEHLKFHNIPFDDIYVGKKPPADAFIDNKAVNFDGDWSRIRTLVQEIMTRSKKAEEPQQSTEVSISMAAAIEQEGFAQGLGNNDSAADQYTDVDEAREDRSITRPPAFENLV